MSAIPLKPATYLEILETFTAEPEVAHTFHRSAIPVQNFGSWVAVPGNVLADGRKITYLSVCWSLGGEG